MKLIVSIIISCRWLTLRKRFNLLWKLLMTHYSLIKNLNKFLQIWLLKIPIVLHMFSLVRVFLNENILKGAALCLRTISYSDEEPKKHSAEYQNYLITRDQKPGKVKKQFLDIKKLTRDEARKPKLQKSIFPTSCNLITQYNPLLPNLKTILKARYLFLQ